MAVLQFNTLGVSGWNNTLQINGVDIAGGISVGPLWIYLDPHVPLWNTESQLVDAGVLEEENILHIESKPTQSGNFDDFIIDNIVIWFKTRTGRVTEPGVPPAKPAS